MGASYYTNPIEFMINTVVDLYILIIMLRYLLQIVRADFYNPVSQFLIKATNPLLAPMRRYIPSIGRHDTSSILLMLALKAAALSIILLLKDIDLSLYTLLILSIADLISLAINVFLFSILIIIIISWINPGSYNPIVGLLNNLTAPLMNPARKLLPPISGLDLSPILVILGLQLLKFLLLPPIIHLAHL